MRKHRTWPDGTYWTCGLGCGMDNQPRIPEGAAHSQSSWTTTPERHAKRGFPGGAGCNAWVDHGHMAWIDACAHAVLSAKVLLDMHKVVRDSGAKVLATHAVQKTASVNLFELLGERMGRRPE